MNTEVRSLRQLEHQTEGNQSQKLLQFSRANDCPNQNQSEANLPGGWEHSGGEWATGQSKKAGGSLRHRGQEKGVRHTKTNKFTARLEWDRKLSSQCYCLGVMSVEILGMRHAHSGSHSVPSQQRKP